MAARPLPFLLVLLAAHLGADPGALDYYEQSFSLEFPDEASAARATVEVAPLYRDAKWAVTQRWDDNRVDSMRVRDLLKRFKMRGTFYLNASDGWYANESSYPFKGEPSKELAAQLREGGHSIGGHTLSHNFLPAYNRQEDFWEILGVRVDREVSSQSPVISFVAPFNAYTNDLEATEARADIVAMLLRSGYYHVADQYFRKERDSELLDSWLLPCDGEPIDERVAFLLASDKQRDHDPNFCFCMHAWPSKWGGSTFPQLRKALARWAGREIWWYANQNELAAYRYQAHHGSLSARREGRRLELRLKRFEPYDLGDAVPLTLRLRGAAQLSVTASAAAQISFTPSKRDKALQLLELPHDPGHGLPQAYDLRRNLANKEEGLDEMGRGVLAGLGSRLWMREGRLSLRLKNGDEPLEGLRLRFRLPLGWEALPDLRLPRLKAGEDRTWTLALTPTGSALLTQGRPYLAAQLDYLRAGRRERLYSDCRSPHEPRDPSFPRGGFLVMGPLPGNRAEFDPVKFGLKHLKQAHPAPCAKVFGQVTACWEKVPESRLDPLHPEIIPAGGLSSPRTFYTWDPSLYYPHGRKLHYLLATRLRSSVSRTAKMLAPRRALRRVYLNGLRVTSRQLELKAGENLLTLLYRPGTHDGEGQGGFHMRNYGPFFRLVDAKGERLTDITYEPPDWTPQAAQEASP